MRIEIIYRDPSLDGRSGELLGHLDESLQSCIQSCRIADVYILDKIPDLSLEIIEEIFLDSVSQRMYLSAVPPGAGSASPSEGLSVPGSLVASLLPDWTQLIEVSYKAGVTDPVALSAREALESALGRGLSREAVVQTAKQYLFTGADEAGGRLCSADLETDELDGGLGGGNLDGGLPTLAGFSAQLAASLYNPLIQQARVLSREEWEKGARPPDVYPVVRESEVPPVEFFSLEQMDDAELQELSKNRLLALSIDEMKAVRSYFSDGDVRRQRLETGIGSDASDVELEILAQTWSEHCKHKIFGATIDYEEREPDGGLRRERIKSLFSTYIKACTEKVSQKKDYLRSVFHDNSGVVDFDNDHLVCFKAETHNSPSALDPYGGAITGIVGVNRDILGTGKGALPIFNTNVLCFGYPDSDPEAIPRGLLHPRQVLSGVHRGIVEGGNQSGIPTVAGAFLFDDSYAGKPLVYCGTGGLMPRKILGEDSYLQRIEPGHKALMLGGRIGKDGIHGATFSSLGLDETSPSSAVQIGDPITQKKMTDFLMEARDRGLYSGITDNGAGGLSSSFGEMAEESGGIRLDLDACPLKYQGLAAWEIFVSESQERMSLAVPPEHIDEFIALAERWDVEASVLGEFTDTSFIEIYHQGRPVCYLELDFLHNGLPVMELRAEWPGPGREKAPAGAAGKMGRLFRSGTREETGREIGPALGPPGEPRASGQPQSPRASQTAGAAQDSGSARAAFQSRETGPTRSSGSTSPNPSTGGFAGTGLNQGAGMSSPDPAEGPSSPPDFKGILLSILADPNVASKEHLIRQYDHEVQASSVVKPFCGRAADGPTDGAVLKPVYESKQGLTVCHGICPRTGDYDTYRMAALAVDEAYRAHIALGGDPERVSALDNFCWPDPVEADGVPGAGYKLAQLVRACRGLYETCVAYGIPLISGKDSMKNDAGTGEKRISIRPSLLISLMGIIDDVRFAQTTDFKNESDLIYLLGITGWGIGGSMLEYLADGDYGPSPRLFPKDALNLYRALSGAIKEGLVASCHDLSDGGLALALAESALGGRLGAAVEIDRIPMRAKPPGGIPAIAAGAAPEDSPAEPGTAPKSEAEAAAAVSARDAALEESPMQDETLVRLFSESPSRFLLSVRPENRKAFERALAGQPYALIGRVTGDLESNPLLTMQYKGEAVISSQLSELEEAFYSFAAGAGA